MGNFTGLAKKMWWWVFLAVIAAVFWVRGVSTLDPDFGWHYQMGRLIWETGGVPATDPFSYTMPSFHFVDHEWLMNVLMYWGYELGGMNLLAAAFASMVVAMIWVVVPRSRRVYAVVPAILAATVWLGRGGVRPQVFSWLMLAILFRWWGEREAWAKRRWLVPVWFGVWANMHGGFALGVVVLGWLIFWRTAQKRGVDYKDLIVWVLGLGATLVNPYGWRLWYEVWMQMSDGNLRWNIAEWLPFFMNVELGFWFLVVLGGFLIWLYKKDLEWWKPATAVGFLAAGMSSLRHMALTMVVMTGLTAELTEKFYRQWAMDETVKKRMKKIFLVLLGVAAVIWVWDAGWVVYGYGKGKYETGYPRQAVEYLKDNLPKGNLFSGYGWGGYLIWKLPEKKVFIDGRMPSWRTDVWPFSAKATKGESEWAFKEYVKTDSGDEFVELFEKYGVTTVLWPKPQGEKPRNDTTVNWLVNFWERMFGKKADKPKSLPKRLEEKGWKKLYGDETAVIYEKAY